MLDIASTTEAIKQNVYWIKDIFTIVFSGAATIIAILTYQRAKETFLQPVRTEVVKRQADLLIEVLPKLEQEKFDKSINYHELIKLNATHWLTRYGFLFKGSETENYVKNTQAGVIFLPDSKGRIDAERIGAFSEKEEKLPDTQEVGRKLYEEAKKGTVLVNRVLLTKGYIQTEKELSNLIDNPFIPSNIAEKLNTLKEELRHNLTKGTVTTVGWVIKELIDRENKANLSWDGVYNEFNKSRHHHGPTLKAIRTEIRKYLKVDSTPWTR